MPARASDGEDERRRLLQAAFTVIQRSGYAQAHITDILAEAGLSTRAFYRHFAAKDDLLRELFRQNSVRSAELLEDRIDARSGSLDKLLAWVEEMLDLAYSPSRRDRARLFRSPAARAAYGDEADIALARLYEPLARVLREGREDGTFPDCDVEQDPAIVHAIVWRYFAAAVTDRPLASREEAHRCILRFCLPALGIDEPVIDEGTRRPA